MIFLKVIPQILQRTLFARFFYHVEISNEFNLPLFSGLLDYPSRIPSRLPNVFNTRLTIDKRVAGCRVIIGYRRRLKPNSSPADSLVISFGLNENHGLNPSQEIRKMWVHYWCPFTGCFFSCFFPPLLLEMNLVIGRCSAEQTIAIGLTVRTLWRRCCHSSAVCCFTTEVIHSTRNSSELIAILNPHSSPWVP